MKRRWRLTPGPFLIAGLLAVSSAPAAPEAAQAARAADTMTLRFGGVDYLHRWSKNGQNEFTPPSDPDLATWRDMVTINLHEKVTRRDQVEGLAVAVLNNYRKGGKVLRADSRPGDAEHAGEYLVVALFSDSTLLEAAFARVTFVEDTGVIVVYSHRVYGKAAGTEMSDWLRANGPRVEDLLMAWNGVPAPSAVRKLPQSD